MNVLEKMIQENFEDSMLINNLSKLEHAQITMNEKLNNIFAQGFVWREPKAETRLSLL